MGRQAPQQDLLLVLRASTDWRSSSAWHGRTALAAATGRRACVRALTRSSGTVG